MRSPNKVFCAGKDGIGDAPFETGNPVFGVGSAYVIVWVGLCLPAAGGRNF